MRRADRLYLSAFQVSNFRAFGNTEFRFEPGPGLVLLVGPNGLGKSTFFEAVEMALTGEVQRWGVAPLSGIDPGAQVRRTKGGQVAKGWKLGLSFQGNGAEAHTVERQGPSPMTGPPPKDIIEQILCPTPEPWALKAANLSSFLHATHILPQSTRLRFLSLDPKERWGQILSQVSGFDRLERATRAVGQGTKRALTQHVNAREDTHTKAKAALEGWRERRKALDDAEAARALRGDALGPAQGLAALGELRDAEGREAAAALSEGDLATMSQGALELEQKLERRVKAAAERLRVWEALRPLLPEYARLGAQLQGIAERLAEAEAAAGNAARVHSEAQAHLGVAQQTLDANQKTLEAHERRLKVVSDYREAQRRLEQAKAERARLQEEVERAASQVTEVGRLLALQLERQQRRLQVDQQAQALQTRQQMLAAATERSTHVRDLTTQMAENEQRAREASAHLEGVEAAKRNSAERLAHLRAEAGAAQARLAASTARHDAIRAAVAAIAAHIHPEVTDCPVCGEVWEPPGTLLGKVQTAVDLDDPTLAEASQSAQQLRESVNTEALALQALEARQAQASSALAGLRARQVAMQTALAELFQHPLLIGQTPESLGPHLTEEAATVEALRRETAPADPDLPSTAEFDVIVAAAQRRLEAAKQEAATVSTRVQTASDEMKMAESRAQQAQAELGAADAAQAGSQETLAKLAAARASHETHVAQSQAERRKAAEGVREATQALATARGAVSTVEAERTKTQAALEGMRSRWGEAGLDAPIDGAALEAHITRIKDHRSMVEADGSLVKRVFSAVRAYQDDRDVVRIRAGLSRDAGGLPPERWTEYEQRLQRRLAEADLSLKQAQKARQAVDVISNRLGDEASHLRDGLASALNEPMERLLPALVQDPMFHGLNLGVEGTPKRPNVGARFGGDQVADQFLSEGQMAGVSLAVLLSMATTFRWCRWPAILLDDPTQHNDLIHATNLIEVLRTLVLTEGFQVFLSTHDRELADFVQNKFQNARIPGIRLRFREPANEAGVVPIAQAWP